MPNGSCSEKGKTRFCTVLGGGLQIICFIFTPKKLGEMESNLTFAYFIQLSWNHQQTWRFHHVFNWWLLWVATTSESWWKHSRKGWTRGWTRLGMISGAKNREKPGILLMATRNPAWKPVEDSCIYRILYIPGGWPWEFLNHQWCRWPISSVPRPPSTNLCRPQAHHVGGRFSEGDGVTNNKTPNVENLKRK